MRFLFSIVLVLSLCCAFAASVFTGGFWAWGTSPFAAIVREAAREGSLARANDAWRARTRFTQELVGELIEDHRTLTDAVAQLEGYYEQEASEALPDEHEYLYGRAVLQTVPGDSEEERCGRHLIFLVKGHSDDGPGLRKTIARLEAELQEIVRAEERGSE